MFKKLDRYIIRKFLVTFFFSLAIFTAIAVVWDIAEKMDDFIEDRPPLNAIIFEYYLGFIPYIAIMLSPMFIFIAVVYFTSRMAAKSEIVAVLSSGVSFYRFLVPYIVAATFLTILIFFANHWLFPMANEKRINFQNTYLWHPYINTDKNIHIKVDSTRYIYLRNYNARDTVGHEFTLEAIKNGRLYSKLKGERITWDNKKKKWIVHEYLKRTIDDQRTAIEKGEKLDTALNLTPRDFGRKSYIVETMTTPELNEFIADEQMKGSENVDVYLVKKYRRTSTPFATFVLTLIAVALSSRKVRGGTGFHIAIGFLIAFSFIFFMRFSITLATNANFPPLLGVWTPNILFGILAVVLIRYAPK